MTLIVHYTSKKELKENIGEALSFTETSIFGPEYGGDKTFTASNRPQLTGINGREFFVRITMKDNRIAKVE